MTRRPHRGRGAPPEARRGAPRRAGSRRRDAQPPGPDAPDEAPAKAVATRHRVALPPPPIPTAQYVRAVAAGPLLFVTGHNPEADGQLVYRGRIDRDVPL